MGLFMLKNAILLSFLMLSTSLAPLIAGGDSLDNSDEELLAEERDALFISNTGGREALNFSPDVSFRFIQNSQNIQLNRMKDLNDIFHFLNIYSQTSGVASINSTTRSELIVQVQSYQNSDGGFGDWLNDRSKAGSTRIAVESLALLGAQPLNLTSLELFINRLQVSGLAYGNFGFRSTITESDADISTTYDAVRVLTMLGITVPNGSGVEEYIHQHRNLDGGYGYQTNREAGIFWPSTTIHTERALLALQAMGTTAEEPVLTTDFLRSVQAPDGGFSNEPTTIAKVSYTWDAVLAFDALMVPLPRPADVAAFTKSNQMPSGGWLEYALDTKTGIHSTHFAVRTLNSLSEQFDHDSVLSYLEADLNASLDGGFGNQPGMDSNIRITFDAITALNQIGRTPNNRTAASEFILNAQNLDGGFGVGGSSVESTYRAVATLHRAGIDVPNGSATVNFIRNAQNLDGGFGFKPGRPSTAAYTYRSLMALNLLASEPINKNGTITYLQNLQNPDGGFGSTFGDQSSAIGSTYRCIRGLTILNAQPLNVDNAETFILSTQNLDGGFRLSPDSTMSPNNLSTAVRTYDAVTALRYLDRPLTSTNSVDNFIKTLRNPDLGFGSKPFFTSEVEDSFTSVSSLYALHPELDTPPQILSSGASIPTTSAGQEIWFNLSYNDTDNQLPDRVALEIDGTLQLMPLSTKLPAQSNLNLTLPVGNHTFRFIISSNTHEVSSVLSQVTIEPVGSPPTINISVSPDEGDIETVFTFKSYHYDADGDVPTSVRISIDGGDWLDMSLDSSAENGTYLYQTTLLPGRHTAKTRVSDGINVVISDNIQSPLVLSPDSSRPDWKTFQKIELLILDKKGVQIEINDVRQTIHEGQQAWLVTIPDELVYVSHDGSNILVTAEDSSLIPQEFSELFSAKILIFSAIILATLLMLIGLKGRVKKRRKRKDLDPWLTSDDYWGD